MHRQPDLFNPMCAEQHAHQGDLFDNRGPADSALHCEVCGEYLTHTPSGYLACPKGHGKLRAAVQEEPDDEAERSGLWFEED